MSVRHIWLEFNAPHEGKRVPFMYLDWRPEKHCLVTIGTGNLLPLTAALGCRFVEPDGSLASHDRIVSVWHLVDSRQDLAIHGGMIFGDPRKCPGNDLRLPPAELDRLFYGKFDEHEERFRRMYPEWDQWPDYAQLGRHSMAWALGPAREDYPKFEAACKAQDWAAAAAECNIKTLPSRERKPRGRNAINYACFLAAARLVACPGADRSELDPAVWRA